MANKHMKVFSTSYVIREMQIKIAKRYHHTSIRVAKTQNTDNTQFWGDVKQHELSYMLVGMQNVIATLEDNLVVSYNKFLI